VGDRAIVNPQGGFIAGPVRAEEGILYAEIDPVQMQAAKWELDVAGHMHVLMYSNSRCAPVYSQ
jgi:nitrilase